MNYNVLGHKEKHSLQIFKITGMTDLLFLTAPPVGRFGRGLLAILRQHESPDGSRHQVQVKHGVALAEERKERKKERGW